MSRRKEERRELFRHLKSGDLAPIYYIHGPDGFMLDAAVDAIVEAALPEGPNDFNFDKFRGKDAAVDQVRAACETLPLMSKRKLVLVRDLQEMPTAELEELADYFADPSPSTCLVFHAMTAQKSIDGRLGAVRKLKKAAQTYEFKAFYENELDDFIGRQAARRGLSLDRGASAYLVEAVGTDLASLDGALEKVDLYLGAPAGGASGPRRVEADDVRTIIAETRIHNVFALTEALGARQFEKALKVLDGMLVAGESPIGAAAMIARHFRIVAKLHDPEVRRMSKNDKARAVGVSPYFLRDYDADAQRFSRPEIERIRQRLVETDLALKSSRLSDRAIMEGLLYDICFRDDHAAAPGRGARR